MDVKARNGGNNTGLRISLRDERFGFEFPVSGDDYVRTGVYITKVRVTGRTSFSRPMEMVRAAACR